MRNRGLFLSRWVILKLLWQIYKNFTASCFITGVHGTVKSKQINIFHQLDFFCCLLGKNRRSRNHRSWLDFFTHFFSRKYCCCLRCSGRSCICTRIGTQVLSFDFLLLEQHRVGWWSVNTLLPVFNVCFICAFTGVARVPGGFVICSFNLTG